MLDSLGPGELDHWLAFYRLEPFGDEWLQAGAICATIANSNPYAKRTTAAQPADFIPRLLPEREQTPAEMASILDGVLRSVGITPTWASVPLSELA
ncbi:MAG: hypothetical protein JSS27_00995 [Planctomycetes bacterium]|nr:hypothetical protein [Planctomycetota bacterium]